MGVNGGHPAIAPPFNDNFVRQRLQFRLVDDTKPAHGDLFTFPQRNIDCPVNQHVRFPQCRDEPPCSVLFPCI